MRTHLTGEPDAGNPHVRFGGRGLRPPYPIGVRDGNWALFAALPLVPDPCMLGYAAGPVPGAACYNAAHTYVGSIGLGDVGLAARSATTL